MKALLPFAAIPTLIMLMLSGCVDNNYDLSDIDTTSDIKIKDLTIPVNIDPITLSEIFDVDNNSHIREIDFNGQRVYAVSETGKFSSDPITIDAFKVEASRIAPLEVVFRNTQVNQAPSGAPRKANGTVSYYTMWESETEYLNYTATNIDPSIIGIREITLSKHPAEMALSFQLIDKPAGVTYELNDLEIFMPKGLIIKQLPDGQAYDSTTGILSVRHMDCPEGKGEIKIYATGMKLDESEASFQNHTLTFSSGIRVKGAMLSEISLETMVQKPELRLRVEITMGNLVVDGFSGRVKYALEGKNLNIKPISLSDIPDFLSQDETDLKLVNPQLYVSVNNPISENKVYYQTGLKLTANRSTGSQSFTLDNNAAVRVGYDHGQKPYNFLLSPSVPSDIQPAFKENLVHYPFSTLGDVLSGKGLPSSIGIDLVDPSLPEQDVNNFQLGVSYPGIEGNYEFLAPLALKSGADGSVIVYRKTEDGWGTEDLDKLTINTLQITATAINNIPLDAELTILPIDYSGKPISGVESTKTTLKAGAGEQPIEATITGTIKNLDGIRIEAVVHAGSDNALAPQQNIVLTNVRAKVSGNYTTDF